MQAYRTRYEIPATDLSATNLREWLYKFLEEKHFSEGFRLWMGSNLAMKKGAYEWTFDIKCAQQLYDSYQESEYWDIFKRPVEGVKLNIVRAAQSDRWVFH